MKVLITGINGFIGNSIARRFKVEGYEVYGVDRLNDESEFQVEVFDLLHGDLEQLLVRTKPDIIVHCAGLASVPHSVKYPEEDFHINTLLVHRLLFALKKCDMSKTSFMLLSSAAVYGQPEQLPISEDAALLPLSPYALHKKMAEEVCEYFAKNYDFDVRVPRIFSAYGPGLKKQIFWDMYHKAKESGELKMLGTGMESRDYIYIDDLVEALYLIATAPKSDNVFWNVASGEETLIKDAASLFADAFGLPRDKVSFNGTVREGDPINWRADIKRLTALGFKCETKMSDGIRKYVEWLNTL